MKINELATKLEVLSTQVKTLQLESMSNTNYVNSLLTRVSHLEDELVHQKRINMLILKGKYGPNNGAPSTPHKDLNARAKDLAKQGHKVVVRGGMLYVDGQLAQ